MLSEKEKEIICIMDELQAEKEMVIGVLAMLADCETEEEKEKNQEKLLGYMYAKGKYLTAQDVLKKASQITLGREQYLPFNLYVRYTGDSTDRLQNGRVYQVWVSYDHDEAYLIEDETGEQEVYPAEGFVQMEVSKVRYTGCEDEDGSLQTTEGFAIGQDYAVNGLIHRQYQCDNGKTCPRWECEPVDFILAKPKQIRPFRSDDGALKCLRQAFEFGAFQGLLDHLSPSCEYISQGGGHAFSDAISIKEHVREVARDQLEKNIFLDCALATVTKSREGNRFPEGTRCLPMFTNGKCKDIAFVREEQGIITGIYILDEPYNFKCDEE